MEAQPPRGATPTERMLVAAGATVGSWAAAALAHYSWHPWWLLPAASTGCFIIAFTAAVVAHVRGDQDG